MPVSTVTSSHPDDADSGIIREDHIGYGFIGKLQGLKYQYRPDITNRATLEKNFREKFEALNRVHLTDIFVAIEKLGLVLDESIQRNTQPKKRVKHFILLSLN